MSQSQVKRVEKDIVIVGGGMVGAATAIGCAQLGLSVAVIEAFKPNAYQQEQAIDLRVSAVSAASESLLERFGALDAISNMRRAAYLGLETWELEGFITRFHSEQVGASHLGHIVENRLIQLALWGQFTSYDNIELFCPSKVEQFERDVDGVIVKLDDGQQLTAKLLIGADGANSQVRTWAGIGLSGWDYAQSAMLINIETELGQQDVTWQQFTPKGPRSLLPLPGNQASLVWYDDASRISQLSQLSNKALAQQIKLHFPQRLDRRFEVLQKGSFKLTRRHAHTYFGDNLVILGDAAHTINPLAGQGVNIGFKDVEALVQTLSHAITSNERWWDNATLAKYQSSRYKENLLMMSAMDLFYAGFSNDLLPLKLIRNAALRLANIDTPIKKQVLKYAMGLK
ncbi:FAD-dependent monooxygenase [Shewanella eurypsychrophilus]|uniref:FAD-dependent monooxygenase n=1 Tax=Shewanella eurypsychrophilus TaxID=2593656 RepID=A0ABX6V9C0_9GAMM|nr:MULTISPECIES: FAD-dependent monooxygenase [Shewanella]QFU24013.1 2-octaprenyl-3-methyl-6-methoxy-1,4-benzoquinol hydroxylase [Shewanella sp. YLB-09]QPG59222.1 FAD-dependent monooxygenase [Shewanella eurypsychrophilus]